MSQKKLIIIGGIAGSGKSTALNAFEDNGFLCIGNLPAALIRHFTNFLVNLSSVESYTSTGEIDDVWNELVPPERNDFALLINCRETNSIAHINSAIQRLRGAGIEVSLLFLDCSDEAALRRFQTTRRPHPLHAAGASGRTVKDALATEREMLFDLRESADLVIDTTEFTPHDLRRYVENYLSEKSERQSRLEIRIVSFGFKYGIPTNADLVFDVRFIENPHFIPELRELTGRDTPVKDFIFARDESREESIEFVKRLKDLLNFLVPRYINEGKRYLTIGIGCTGGKHRSVALADKLACELEELDLPLEVYHRDL